MTIYFPFWIFLILVSGDSIIDLSLLFITVDFLILNGKLLPKSSLKAKNKANNKIQDKHNTLWSKYKDKKDYV